MQYGKKKHKKKVATSIKNAFGMSHFSLSPFFSLTRAPCWVIFILKNYSWLQCAIPIDWLFFLCGLHKSRWWWWEILHSFALFFSLHTKYLFKISPSTFPKLFFLTRSQIEVNFMHHTAIPSRNGKLLIKNALVNWRSVIPWNYFKMKTKQKKFFFHNVHLTQLRYHELVRKL